MRSVRSRIWMRWDSNGSSGCSNRHSSTASAFSEKIEKFTPSPSHVAPCGYGEPGQIRTSGAFGLQEHAPQRGKGEVERPGPRVRGDGKRLNLAEVAPPAAAIQL